MNQEQIETLKAVVRAIPEGKLAVRVLAGVDALTKANEELRAEVELAKQEGVAETLQQIDCLTGGDGEYRLSTFPDRNCPDEDAMCKKIVARFDDLRATIDRLTKERDEAVGTLRWAHDTLYEINPSNYDHDEVCKLNNASVGVILGIAPLLGEKHGKTDAWWHSRIEGQRAQISAATAESDACWKNLVECGRQRDEARTRLSAMQKAIDKAVRRADAMDAPVVQWPVKHITEPLRPFATKPDTPSERIMSDKDRGNPVEGAHPMTKPEPEVDPLVAATQRLLQYEGHMVWCGHGNDDSKPCVCGLIDAQSKARDALAARNHTEGRTDG